jgi:hypothetical protein
MVPHIAHTSSRIGWHEDTIRKPAMIFWYENTVERDRSTGTRITAAVFLSKEIREMEILFPEVLAAYKHFITFVKDNIFLFFRRQPEGEKK